MSNHHTHEQECPLCSEKIKTAHEILQNLWPLLKREFPDCHISWAFRDQETQEIFYRDGRTKAHWPSSAHNHMRDGKPCSLALDLFQLDSFKVARFPPGFYFRINQFLIKLQAPIEWSGQWKTFGESNHYQVAKEALKGLS